MGDWSVRFRVGIVSKQGGLLGFWLQPGFEGVPLTCPYLGQGTAARNIMRDSVGVQLSTRKFNDFKKIS